MKWKNILWIVWTTFILTACEKQEIPVFASDDQGIYFQRVSSFILGSTTEYYGDSTAYSFASVAGTVKNAVLSATARTMGKVVDYDRPFKVVIDKEESTAIEGIHYEANLDTVRIPAGASSVYVRVRFFRTDDLTDKTVRLVLRLEDNEYFKCYLPEYKNTNAYSVTGAMIRGDRYVFSLSEMYTEPNYWTWFGVDYFGNWTPKKYTIVNMVCGLNASDWGIAGQSGAKVSLGRFNFFAVAVQKYLQEQADAGEPVLDSDENYMQLAPAYVVNYSQYE